MSSMGTCSLGLMLVHSHPLLHAKPSPMLNPPLNHENYDLHNSTNQIKEIKQQKLLTYPDLEKK
jgi:hypothetical protein